MMNDQNKPVIGEAHLIPPEFEIDWRKVMGATFYNCTDPSHPDYNAEFDSEMRRIHPNWFVHDN